MYHMLKLVGLLVLFICRVVVSLCNQDCYYCHEKFGEVYADDCYVFVNQIVNITCQLNEGAIGNSSLLFFERNGSRLDDENIILVDNRTAVLSYKISPNDRRTNFFCYNSLNNTKPVGKLQFLYIEYYPQEVANFSCIWEGLAPGKLKCFWSHPVEYLFPQYIKVTFEWTQRNETEASRFLCTYVLDSNRCEDIHNITDDTIFIIYVTNTIKNVTTSSLVEIGLPDTPKELYGKPHKVENVTMFEKNQTTIKLKWYSSELPKIYIIRYNTTNGEKEIQTMNKSVTVQSLTAYTIYQFDIVGKYTHSSYQSVFGLPSDPVSFIARTSQDVAKYPPRVAEGGFMINLVPSTDKSNITVFWQVFEEMNANGPVIEYKINLYYSNGSTRSFVTGAGVSHYLFTVINVPETVRIRAGTEVGMSVESQPIHIRKEFTNPPDFLLERSDNFNIFITWTAILNRKVKGYTIYWCERTNGCQKQIEWKQIEENKITDVVQNLDSNKKYLFGLSMETENGGSGFSWKSCYYNRDAKPEIPKPVQILKQTQNEVIVIWTRPECNVLFPFIEYYIIYWCRLNLIGDQCLQGYNESAQVNTSITDINMKYTISHLRTGARYAVWLQAISAAGKISLPGQKNYNASTTDMAQSENQAVTEIVLFTVLPFVFIIVAGLVSCLEIRCHCMRRCFEKPNIELISIPPSHMLSENQCSQNTRRGSTDSGHASMKTRSGSADSGHASMIAYDNSVNLSDEYSSDAHPCNKSDEYNSDAHPCNKSDEYKNDAHPCKKLRLSPNIFCNGSMQTDTIRRSNATKYIGQPNRMGAHKKHFSDYWKISEIVSGPGEANLERRYSDPISYTQHLQEDKQIEISSSTFRPDVKQRPESLSKQCNYILLPQQDQKNTSDVCSEVYTSRGEFGERIPAKAIKLTDENLRNLSLGENSVYLKQPSAIEFHANVLCESNDYVSNTIFIKNNSLSPCVERGTREKNNVSITQRSAIGFSIHFTSEKNGYVSDTKFTRISKPLPSTEGETGENRITKHSAVGLPINFTSEKNGYVSDAIFTESSSTLLSVEKEKSGLEHDAFFQNIELISSPVHLSRSEEIQRSSPNILLESNMIMYDIKQYNSFCDDVESKVSWSSSNTNDFDFENTNSQSMASTSRIGSATERETDAYI